MDVDECERCGFSDPGFTQYGHNCCKHEGETERRFGGAVTCSHCNRIISYWKSPQPVLHMGPPAA